MITQEHIAIFKSLLEGEHGYKGRTFKTDEIQVKNDMICIWDLSTKTWYYLTNDLEWIHDEQDESILTFNLK